MTIWPNLKVMLHTFEIGMSQHIVFLIEVIKVMSEEGQKRNGTNQPEKNGDATSCSHNLL